MVAPNTGAFFTKQFKLSSLLFNTDRPYRLGTPQAGRWQHTYIAYRCVWCMLWTAFLIYDISTYIDHPDIFYTFMSNWMLVILVASTWSQLLAAVYCHIRRTELLKLQSQGHFTTSRGTPVLLQLNWFLFDMASPVSLFISVVYFTAIHTIQPEEKLDFATICVHLVNSLYILLDMMIVAVPFRLLHFWLPEIFGISYTIFSILYWGTTGAEPVYHILDYEKSPGMSAVYLLIVAFIATPIFHTITFSVYWLRVLLYSRFCADSGRTQGAWEGGGGEEEGVDARVSAQYKASVASQEAVVLNEKI